MASNIQQLDREHHLTPFADWHALKVEGGRRIIESGEGVFVVDNAGQRILDGMSGLWNMPLGYSCLEVKQAIKTQLDKLPYYNSFFKTSNAPAAELSARLAQLCPGDISHFFYASSGSEAIDSAYRLLCRYWQIHGQAQKRIIVARKMAYHGSSVFGARLGGMAAMHAQIPEVLPVIQHIDNPYGYDLGKDYNDPEFGRQCAQQLETLIEKIGSANIAAFIGEPIQGAAGVYIPPDSYWPEIARICRQHDILLVSDEVICGFGRTGKHFGCEHWGVQPDMLVMAKASATVICLCQQWACVSTWLRLCKVIAPGNLPTVIPIQRTPQLALRRWRLWIICAITILLTKLPSNWRRFLPPVCAVCSNHRWSVRCAVRG